MGRAKGVFIAVEGIDAAGKKTQTAALKAWLSEQGLSVQTMSFPAYQTTIGREIRKFLDGRVRYPPQVRAMLYAANRWETKGALERAIEGHDAVIVNRYVGSNLAYGTSSGLSLGWLKGLEQGLPQPDLVIVLDATPSNAALRRRHNKDSYERDSALQSRARRAYLRLAGVMGWTVVRGDGGVAETARAIQAAVTPLLRGEDRRPARR